MSEPTLSLRNIKKSFPSPSGGELNILNDVSLDLFQGENTAIVGKSGSGKSTLLHVAGCLLRPDSGSVTVLGEDVSSMSDAKLSQVRNLSFGFVYQRSLLLSDFTALENVMLPALIKGLSAKESEEKARELLSAVGLSEREKHRPSELSGGEKQRVALSRALINDPAIILADEPTGSLDEENAALVENLLLNLVSEFGKTLLLVTHNPDFAAKCSSVYTLEGKILTLRKGKEEAL